MIPVCEPYLRGNELKYVAGAVQSGWISSSGSYVKAFERAFAHYCGVNHAVCVCNGTAALHLALTCLGISQGDEVIIPSFTMIASAFAVCYTGAKPVFVDVDKRTWNIDTRKIEEQITDRTKAIMAVHIFGNPCDMDAIHEIASRHGLFVIEDAAEAHGATYKGKKTGNLSDMAAFSFFANKNLTTGEGGAVTTNHEGLYRKALYYKNLCFDSNATRNYRHADIGFNYRMSNIHAAIGLAQTEKADEYKNAKIRNGNLFRKYLRGIKGIQLQEHQIGGENVFWVNGILINPAQYGRNRSQLIAHLKSNGVDTRVFFVGMHRQESLIKFGCDCSGQFPETDNLSENGLYLPSGINLNEETIESICTLVRRFQETDT